jgi:hypothetical protein
MPAGSIRQIREDRMRIAAVLSLTLLAACAGGGTGLRPQVSEASRADGVVALSSIRTIYMAAEPDWTEAAETADRRCGGWGYDDRATFAGWRDICQAYDRYGRCVRTETIRYYSCAG